MHRLKTMMLQKFVDIIPFYLLLLKYRHNQMTINITEQRAAAAEIGAPQLPGTAC